MNKYCWIALSFGLTLSLFTGCSSMNYQHTVSHVDIPQFMGTWYVWTGRTTFLEKNAYSSIEKYTWNEPDQRIDIDFSCHIGSFDGEIRKIPQKAWIVDKETNAHWKVQPFWPLKFNYLVIDLDPQYQWTAIGVPSGSYLWIMGRTSTVSEAKLSEIVERIKKLGYPVDDLTRVPQK